MKRSWYRKQYVVDPKLQLKIIFLLAGISLKASIIICVIAYERMIQLGTLFSQSIVPTTAQMTTFHDLAQSLIVRLLVVVAIMIIAFIGAGVVLTNRIAGPIWRLQDQLQRFLDGEKIEPISFRQRDEFQELPALINKLVEGYKKT